MTPADKDAEGADVVAEPRKAPGETYCGLCDSEKHVARHCPATRRMQADERRFEKEFNDKRKRLDDKLH